MAEASDFKFGTQLGFAKARHKITSIEKSGCGVGLGELPKILEFPIIFLQRLKLATSKLACCWGVPKSIIKSHTEEKVDVALCYRSSQDVGFPFNICATAEASYFTFGMQLGLAKAHH